MSAGLALCLGCGEKIPDAPQLGGYRVEPAFDATVVSMADGASDLPDALPMDARVDASDAAALPTDASVGDAADASSCGYRTPPAAAASVLQYRKNPSRDGVYVDPAFTPAAISAMRTRFTVPLTGQVYAQPLYMADVQNKRELFIAVTEANHVTVVDGCGQQLWDHPFGIPAAAADLPCGGIYPSLGITGTPIIDATSRTIYFDAMTQTGSGSAGLRHLIHAVSIDDGFERDGWPVNVSAVVAGFDPSHQNQRGALLLFQGTLYVPYGGHYGDCGQYYGWIVGVPVSSPTSAQAWRTIASAPWDAGPPISGGGFWAVGGLSTDGTSLFAVSGNTMAPSDASRWNAPDTWVGGETVFRFGPGPSFSGASTDYFCPSNWQSLDDGDEDLGGAGAVPYDVGGSHYLVAMDKMGHVYVLNRNDLSAPPVTTIDIPNCEGGCDVIGAPLVYTTSKGTYVVVPEFAGVDPVFLLSGDPPVLSPLSDGGLMEFGEGAAIATTTDGASDFYIWNASSDRLSAEVGDGMPAPPGSELFLSLPDGVSYLDPPIVANGRVVVATCGMCGPTDERSLSPQPQSNGQLVFVY
jgi:hypothetical protein